MGFDRFKDLFSRNESPKQPHDVIGSLDQGQRNTLNVIRDAYIRTGEFTGEQLQALSFVKDALTERYGVAAMESAIATYMKETPVSRLEELQEVVARNSHMKTVLLKCLADVEASPSPATLAALEQAKQALRVSSPDTFSSADVEAVCAALKESDDYSDYINRRVLAASPAVAPSAPAPVVTGVAPQLPTQPMHRPAGTPNLDWTPPTANDTLHTPPPTPMSK